MSQITAPYTTSWPYISVEEDGIEDPTYGAAVNDVHLRARKQALILQHFQSRWKDEYLTALREFLQGIGMNVQTIKAGDVVLVYNDTPHTSWKMAVIEELIRGNDGVVRAANIRTPTGQTNRPLTRLVQLEISSSDSELSQQPLRTGTLTPTGTITIDQNSEVTDTGMSSERMNSGHPQR